MPQRFSWKWIALGAAVLLVAKWLDERRPFPPVLRNHGNHGAATTHPVD